MSDQEQKDEMTVEGVSVCECGDFKDQHENGEGPSNLLPVLGEPRCRRYRFHHKEERRVYRPSTVDNNFIPEDAVGVKECPLCGASNIAATKHSSYHSGTCSLANHSIPNEGWNNFYCWGKMEKELDIARTNSFEDDNDSREIIRVLRGELYNLISQLEAIQQINDIDVDGAKKALTAIERKRGEMGK